MKVKRYKKLKKTMSFYINNFKFREPFQILVDGNFCYAALNNKINIADNIPRYLQGEIKLLTTQCTIMEMENLGKKLGGALIILKRYGIHRCGHEGKPVAATKCLLSMLGRRNDKHYIIATQDKELQEEVRRIPGVPLLYLHIKTPVLEQPSDASTKFVNEGLAGLSDYERQKFEKLKAEMGITNNTDKKRKKKKIRGKNPLSCLKKNKKKVTQDSQIKRKESELEKEKKTRKKVRIPKHVKEELQKIVAQK